MKNLTKQEGHNRKKALLIFSYVCLATLFYWRLNGMPLYGIDDANIFMVYMRNFANGHGFVYNIGGERVEGFTSLLWTLIGSAYFKLNVYPEVGLFLTNLVLISFVLYRLVQFIDRELGEKRVLDPVTVFFCGLLFIFPGYFEWTILSLMETGLWSALLILSYLNLVGVNGHNLKKNNIRLCLLLFLMTLCRPESLLWGLVIVGIRIAQLFLVFEKKRRISSSFQVLSGYLAGAVGVTFWRLAYFGYPFPNTYYAKVSSDRWQNVLAGLEYLQKFFFIYNPFVFIVSVFLIVLFIWRSWKGHSFSKFNLRGLLMNPIAIGGSYAVITFLIPLVSGGDHFNLSRFIQPTLPIIYVLFVLSAYSLKEVSNIKPQLVQYALVLSILIVLLFTPKIGLTDTLFSYNGSIENEFAIATYDRVKSEKLSVFFDQLPEYPTIAQVAAGANAFSYKGDTYDLLGLNDVEMAHAKGEKGPVKNHGSFVKSVFLDSGTDILRARIINDTLHADERPEKGSFYNLILDGLFYDDKFNGMYRPVIITRRDLEEMVFVYARTDFLKVMDKSPFYNCKILCEFGP